MLSETVELECRDPRLVVLLAPGVAVSGADAQTGAIVVVPMSSNDAPYVRATNVVTRANIHTTVNGVARTECRATSIMAN